MGVHAEGPLGRAAAVIRHGRRRPRQCHDGILLVDDADRTAEPSEVEDPDRAGERNLRVHRSVLQPASPPLRTRVRHSARIRPRSNATGTHHRWKLATTTGNQAVGQVNLSPIGAAVPQADDDERLVRAAETGD